jgi:hypothetical protein
VGHDRGWTSRPHWDGVGLSRLCRVCGFRLTIHRKHRTVAQRARESLTLQSRAAALWRGSPAFRYFGTSVGVVAAWFAVANVNRALAIPVEYSLVGLAAVGAVVIILRGSHQGTRPLVIAGHVILNFGTAVGAGYLLAHYAPTFIASIGSGRMDVWEIVKAAVVALFVWLADDEPSVVERRAETQST